MDELGERMTAAEFEEWAVMEMVEGIGPMGFRQMGAHALAAHANGPLRHPDERLWRASDMVPMDPWGEVVDTTSTKPTESRAEYVARINREMFGAK